MAVATMTLDSGMTVALEVESQHVTTDTLAPAGRASDKALELTRSAFSKGILAVSELCELVRKELDQGEISYSEAELSLDVTFSTEADVKVLRAGGEATLGLKIRWNGPDG